MGGPPEDIPPADADRARELAARVPALMRGTTLVDFAQTADLIDTLDLVVSVDTAVAHLAGAMGRPVWILLPFSPDFRWMLERDDTPWYPGARLFRCRAPGDWDVVVDDVMRL